jgi:hypothetical protein
MLASWSLACGTAKDVEVLAEVFFFLLPSSFSYGELDDAS